MATTATPSTWKGHSHSHSQSHSHAGPRSSRPLTTPRPNLAVTSPSTHMRSPFTPSLKTPQTIRDVKSPSPSYFGFVVGEESIPRDSGPGPHTRQNWDAAARDTSRPVTHDERKVDYEGFRRQSEKNVSFSLGSLPLTRPSSVDPASQDQNIESPVSPRDASSSDKPSSKAAIANQADNPFFLGIQRQDSPLSMSPRHNVADASQARLSLPAHEIQRSLEKSKVQRSDTLPPSATKEVHAMVAPQEVARLVEQNPDNVIILDLRVYPQYAASRVRGALNLCIPTTLLKRPAFTIQKLADTFTTDADKNSFSKWRSAQYIIVYDASSSQPKEAITSFTVLKKFNVEGWKGAGYVIKGGFGGVQKLTPQLVDTESKSNIHPSGPVAAAPQPGLPQLPVAGGCAMPATKNAANPFFGNIRQNMDLLDGVGQIPIKKPAGVQASEEKRLPGWLRRAASSSNEGKDVSNKFLGIEKLEQKRMQKALSGSVQYGNTSQQKRSDEVQVAGIEKGSKNRYNNIFPYEHSRVRLQNVPSHGCDYVNASYVKTSYSDRKYIATQAPIPQTFDDFWRVIWEQDARVIVMLTAEAEGGQVKSHAYWKTGDYGQLKVKQLREQKVSLTRKSASSADSTLKRPATLRRQTTTSATPGTEKRFNFEPSDIKASTPKPEEEPAAIIRQFTISHSAQLSQPAREITQIHYTQWPDFGAPASPTSILSLIKLVDKFQRDACSPSSMTSPSEPVNARQRPIVVHCSAGCGRTGTFCTIDSVIDMLKRQRLNQSRGRDDMDIDTEDDWTKRDDIDLVAKAVEDFRGQRLSMVQNLRQFVLCYESILQWLHDENTK
ncbi:phosphotyrosine-specific ptp2-like protein [Lithohypha guttulata]|nr:phosphotyrosine-specific ptp2-like protein [Lithohypha guttulata]